MSPPYQISSVRFAFGGCAVSAAAFVAIAGLVGLGVGSPALSSLFPGLPPISPAAALAVVAASGSWLLLQSEARAAGVAGLALAAVTAVLAGAALLDQVFGLHVGVDELAARVPRHAAEFGKTSPAVAVSLLFAAAALALTRFSSDRAEDIRQFARLAGLAVPLFVLALYIYDPAALSAIRGFRGTSLNIALCLALLLLAIGFDRSTASLRWQVAHIGVVVVVPLAALTVHFASAEREIALSDASARLAGVARLGAVRQDAVIEQARQMLVFIARSPEVRADGAGCSGELAAYQPLNTWVRGLFVVDRNLKISCSARPDMVGLYVGDRDYVRDAFATGSTVISGFFVGRPTGEPRIAVSVPLRGGAADRIIAVSLDLSALGDPLAELSGELPEASLTLVDKHGVVIARSPGEGPTIGADLAGASFVTQALASPEKPFEAAGLDGESAVFVARKVLSGQGALIVGVPKDRILEPVDSRLNRRLLLISMILAGSLAIGVLGSEALVLRPLRRLIAYAGRLEAGDLAARPDVVARGEVGALGRALAVTAAAIEDRERRLGEAEALFRGLFDHSPDAKVVVAVGRDGGLLIETWNMAATKLCGFAAEDVVGRRPRDVFGGARGEAVEDDLMRTLATGRVMTVERESTVAGPPAVF
ncbi:MAG: HAMP domain-containing protein, partial [Hansschlegelia sp.]